MTELENEKIYKTVDALYESFVAEALINQSLAKVINIVLEEAPSKEELFKLTWKTAAAWMLKNASQRPTGNN